MKKTINVEVAPLGGEVKKFCLDATDGIPTVGDILDRAELEPAEGGLYLNGEATNAEAQLRDGDVVLVVPKVKGG